MTSEQYVKQYLPDAQAETDIDGIDIWSGDALLLFIGSGDTEYEAWDEAKKWVDNNPDLKNKLS
jgi:hypothetical protein